MGDRQEEKPRGGMEKRRRIRLVEGEGDRHQPQCVLST
jgi:hypothetical protein